MAAPHQGEKRPSKVLPKHLLLIAAIRDPALSKGDAAVLSELLERHRYGNSRASYSHLAGAADVDRRTVARSVGRLVSEGYVAIGRQAAGTREAEYLLPFDAADKRLGDIVARIRDRRNSASVDTGAYSSSVDIGAHSESTSAPTLGGLESTSAPTEYPFTRPGYQPGTGEKGTMSSPGAATPAPDTAAGRAVPGRAPVAPTKDAFSELFEAYGLKHDRAKARQAYQQLEPDEVLHEALVAAATEWRAAHERNDTPTQYRTRLYNWISQEKYLEDPPAPHVDRKADAIGKKKRAPKAAKAPKPKPAPRAAQPAPQPPDEPAEWRRLRVAATSTSEPRDGVTVARFEFEGGASPIVFPIIHTEQRTQGRGREKLAILCRAAARPRIDDTDELLGAEIIALVRSDTIERYHLPDSGPAPACVNDNTDVAVAA